MSPEGQFFRCINCFILGQNRQYFFSILGENIFLIKTMIPATGVWAYAHPDPEDEDARRPRGPGLWPDLLPDGPHPVAPAPHRRHARHHVHAGNCWDSNLRPSNVSWVCLRTNHLDKN
jgi:hypothetical protein